MDNSQRNSRKSLVKNNQKPKTSKNNDASIELLSETTKPKIVSNSLQTTSNQIKKPLLNFLDTLICLTIIAPCVVGFWRSLWLLMEVYNNYFPPWESLFFSYVINILFNLIQNPLNEIFHKTNTIWKKVFVFFITKLYICLLALSNVMNWRGIWAILDKFVGVKFTPRGTILKETGQPLVICAAVSLLSLIALKCLVNCCAPPLVVCLDRKKDVFTVPTFFKSKLDEKASLYILDCLFSVLVVGTLVVFVWRGAWALLDMFLFPADEDLSAWGSLIIGYAAVAIAFMLQPLMRWICDRISGAPRLLIADLFIIFSLIGTVNVWRGIWNLLNIYFLPDNIELSCWITHWVCLAILVSLGCSNSLLVRGVYIDAEEPAGKCVVFPCYYLRLIFQKQKLKLRKNRKQTNDKGKTELVSVKSLDYNHVIVDNTNDQFSQIIEINHKDEN